MEISAKTDKGRVRELNEDSCFVAEHEKFVVAVVADGMGGHNAGEIASLCATEGLKDYISSEDITENTNEKLLECFKKINSDIYKKGVTTRGLIGMGTTLTCAVIIEDKIHIAHVGDTRVYIINDSVTRLTEDHSYVEELLRMGRITKEEAKTHPGRNQLTRAVGTEDEIKTDLYEAQIKKGDILLLTSDGLTNMLEDDEIKEILFKYDSLDEALSELIYEANLNGGFDNITAVAVKY